MICHQFEPIEVLASDQALQWICYITWSRAGGTAAREYFGQEINDLCIVEFTAFSTLGHLFHFSIFPWLDDGERWLVMICLLSHFICGQTLWSALSFPWQILKKKLASVPIMPSKSVVRQSVGLRELTEKLEIDGGLTCVEFGWMLQMQNQSASMCSNIFSWILLDSHHHPASQFCISVAPPMNPDDCQVKGRRDSWEAMCKVCARISRSEEEWIG